MSDRVPHAWVDESVHLDVAPSGIYVLAATIGDTNADLESVRDDLRSLVPVRQDRLHWHTEGDAARGRIVKAIADLDLDHLVIVRTGVNPKRQERARRKCLERLLFELSGRGLGQAWLEGRDRKLNKSDADLVEALRGSRSISTQLRVRFLRPLDEPMLWVPDAVAGAVALARKGRGEIFRKPLGPKLQEIDV